MMSSCDRRTEACDNASHRQGPGSVILVPPPQLLQHSQFGAVQTSACPRVETSQSALLAHAKREQDASSTSNEERLHDGHVSPVVDQQRSHRTESNVAPCSDVNCDCGCADYGHIRCPSTLPPRLTMKRTIRWLPKTDSTYLVTSTATDKWLALLHAPLLLPPAKRHKVSSQLNGAQGEVTGTDDHEDGNPGAAKPPTGGKTAAPVGPNSGVDAGLRQLAGVTPDKELRPKKTKADKKRDHKSANARQHNSKAKTQPVERPHADKPLVPLDEKEKPKPDIFFKMDPSHEGKPPVEKEMSKRERKLAEYKPELDQAECKIFIRVPTHLLGRSWWPLAWRCVLFTFLSCAYMLTVDLLFIDHPMYIFCTLAFVACASYFFYKYVVRPLMHSHRAPTNQWADNQRDPVFGFTELDLGTWWYTHENLLEVNAMLRNGYNAYHYVTYSKEIMEFLTHQKHGKPSSFSQQQYASYALREFDHIDAAIVKHTATVHHQNLLVDHYKYALSQGDVDIGIERM